MVGRAVAFGVLAAILCASLGSAEEGPQKFEATITAQFEGSSLQELADMEAQLRKLLGGANDLKIQIVFRSPGSEGITDLDGQLYLNLPYRGYGTIRP